MECISNVEVTGFPSEVKEQLKIKLSDITEKIFPEERM